MRATNRIRRIAAATLLAGALVGAVAAQPAAQATQVAAPLRQLADGALVQRGDGPEIAMIVDGARVDFADRNEAAAAGCGSKVVTKLSTGIFDALPDKPDPLYAAIDHSVDMSKVTPDPVFRRDCLPLYRADGRDPATIFAEGFAAKDVQNGQYDIRSYVLQNQSSPFVSTTYRDDLYKSWKPRFYYFVDAPGGIDVNATIGDDHKYADQLEVAFPGGVQTRFIVKGCPVDRETLELIKSQCESNPNYRAWRL